MIGFVEPIEPVFIARRQRIPDFNLVCCITIRRAIKPFARDVVQLKALTVNRCKVDGDCIEVALRKVVGDIADSKASEKLIVKSEKFVWRDAVSVKRSAVNKSTFPALYSLRTAECFFKRLGLDQSTRLKCCRLYHRQSHERQLQCRRHQLHLG